MPNSGNRDQRDDIGLSVDGVDWHWYRKIGSDQATADATTSGAAQPVVRASTGPGEDLPRPQRSWHKGSGYSKLPSDSEIEGVIDYTWPGDTRKERSILPPSKLEELPMPTHDDGSPITGRWTDSFELYWTPAHPDAPDFFALLDHYCLRLDVDSSVPVIDQYFGTDFTPLSAVLFKGPAWVGGDENTTGIWKRDSFGWTHNSAPTTLVHRRLLAVAKVRHGQAMANGSGQAGQEIQTMFGTSPLTVFPGFFVCTDNPFDDTDWYPGEVITLGGDTVTGQINAIASAPAAVAFVKPEGVFLHNGTTSMHLTPYWFDDYDRASGFWARFYRNSILASHARYLDLVPYSFSFQQAPIAVTPGGTPLPNESPIHGRVTAGTTVDGEPAVAMYIEDLNVSAICMGFPAELVGVQTVSPLIWHFALQVIPGRVDVMAVSSIANPGDTVLPWMHCLTSQGPGLSTLDTEIKARWFRFRLARGGNPLMDSTYPFATEWTAYLTEDDLGVQFAGTEATVRRIACTSQGGDFGIFSVSVDGGPYIEQGQVSSPGSSFRAAQEVSGRRFKWKVEGRGWEDDPYELQSLTIHYILSPDEIERDIHQIVLEPRMETRDGTSRDVDIAAEEQFLRYLQTLGDVHYLDPTGQEWLGKIVPGRQRVFVQVRDGEWGVALTFGIDRIAMIRYWGRGPRYGDGSDI